MRIVKIFQYFFILAIFFILTPKVIYASEGIIELRSTKGTNQKCFVMSLLTNAARYSLLVSCRNLVYPSNDNLSTYILWSNPTKKDSKPARIGDLGFGRISTYASGAFSSLFVTKEANASVRTPSTDVVMQGNIQPIQFLDGNPTNTPTPKTQKAVTPTITKSATPTTTVIGNVTPTPTPLVSPVSKMARAVVTFVAILLAFIILGVVIFVIYRYRKSNL